MSNKSETESGKFFLILDETLMQYFREPRSRKRRIRRKWRARAENYRPNPFVVGECVMLGALARFRSVEGQVSPSYQPPRLRMHPETWAKTVKIHPEIRARAIILSDEPPLGVVPWTPRIPFSLQRKSP